MSGSGGTKAVRCAAALIAGILLAGGMAACAYEDDGDPQPAAAEPEPPICAASPPTKDPGVLGMEASNYAELRLRLAEAPGSVLLADAGPADGPGVGFTKAATVKATGPYTVTAACVGIPRRPDFPHSGWGRGGLSLDVRLLGGPVEGRCAAERVCRGPTDPTRPDRRLDRGSRRDKSHGQVRRTGAETVGLLGADKGRTDEA